jgi:hypothetical protein
MVISRRGTNSTMSFLVALSIILLLGLSVNILDFGVEPEWHYKITSAESTRECNIALMNLMKAEVPNNHYDYAQAIALDPIVATQIANEQINLFFDNVDFEVGECLLGDEMDRTHTCCSQYVSDLEGLPIEVSLVFTNEVNSYESTNVDESQPPGGLDE